LIICQSIIATVYGNISENILSDNILDSVILAPKNNDCTLIPNQIPGEQRTYHRYDKIICDNDNAINNYPVEFLNSLTISGLPPHKIVLKVNCIVLLIRNLNTMEALVNGRRIRIKFMHCNAIDCEVLTGTALNKRILISRMKFNIFRNYSTI
jgi:PIF1 helicase.